MISNEPTGLMVKVIRATSRGSDYGALRDLLKKYARSIRSTLRKGKKES